MSFNIIPGVSNAEGAVAILNDLLEHEPDVISALFCNWHPCEDDGDFLIDHPTVQVAADAHENVTLGVLGILNGIFGADENHIGFIGMEVSDDRTKVLRFYYMDEEARSRFLPPV